MIRGLPFVRRRLGAIATAVWFVGMLVLGAGLLARHLVALPAPEKDQKLAQSLDSLRNPSARGTWLAVHVLYSECRCSGRVAEHLLGTARPQDWSEMVLWVGPLAPPSALEHRFDVRRVTSDDLSRYGIEAAPLLVVLSPGGQIRYAGGYTERKQGPNIDDLRILDDARRPGVLASLPVFGCAVSDRLRRQLARLPTP